MECLNFGLCESFARLKVRRSRKIADFADSAELRSARIPQSRKTHNSYSEGLGSSSITCILLGTETWFDKYTLTPLSAVFVLIFADGRRKPPTRGSAELMP